MERLARREAFRDQNARSVVQSRGPRRGTNGADVRGWNNKEKGFEYKSGAQATARFAFYYLIFYPRHFSIHTTPLKHLSYEIVVREICKTGGISLNKKYKKLFFQK